ncbi:DUF6578 domain-containing protein [Streptomyces sp. CA-253872]|uniref:DUF6578 domain-containing protein n=1 Tax=Streptomyces sp. CA-253872 TaxID=3240067 RepID=UPI003D936D6A
MTRRQVFYESRQFECCGEPFAVGDTVRWPLMPEARDEGPQTVECRVGTGARPGTWTRGRTRRRGPPTRRRTRRRGMTRTRRARRSTW